MGSKKSIISSMKKTQIPWVMIALVALLVVCVMPKLMMGCNGGGGVGSSRLGDDCVNTDECNAFKSRDNDGNLLYPDSKEYCQKTDSDGKPFKIERRQRLDENGDLKFFDTGIGKCI